MLYERLVVLRRTSEDLQAARQVAEADHDADAVAGAAPAAATVAACGPQPVVLASLSC